MTAFPARFAGTCPACGTRIAVGDPLTWDDDHRAVHADCPNPEPRPTPVCPRCWQATASNGACGCDE